MRTRMSGGVGRAVSNGGPYPISSDICGAERVPIGIVMLPNAHLHVTLIAACSPTIAR